MRILVTGATGYLGSAVVKALVAAGHEVGGLARSREREAAVKALGAVPIFGHLADPETYQHFAAESAAVIQCGFESADVDRASAEAIMSAQKAEGYDKHFVLTSGVLVLGETGSSAADESGSTETPWQGVAWRPGVERYVLQAMEGEYVTSVVRPGFVYGGASAKSVLHAYASSALERGAAEYIGDGKGRLPYVHVDDLAQLYRAVVEKRAKGIFHGVDGSSATHLEIATAVAKAAGKDGKTRSLDDDAGKAVRGKFLSAFKIDERVKSTRTSELGWKPEHTNVLEGVQAAVDFAKK